MSEKKPKHTDQIEDNNTESLEEDLMLEDQSESSENTSDGISSYIKKDSVWTNLILAALFSNFLYFYYMDFTGPQPKFSSFLMMIQVFFLVVFFVYRDYPKRVSYEPRDWAFALAGTWLPMLILPVDNLEIPIFTTFQFIGILISTAGILSLNTSFGIVPAIRNIKTRWMYRFVRHPIYFGYMISLSCMVINNFTILNLVVLFAIISCDVMRIIFEERVLSEDPMYEMYKMRTKYRLIPYVW